MAKKKEELKINQTQNLVNLETAITEGNKGLITYEFDYPNTDLTVEVKLKPLTNPELTHLVKEAEITGNTVDLEMLHQSMFNTDGSSFPIELLEELPAGVVQKLTYKIADISGIDLNAALANRRSSLEDLPGF